VAFSAAEQFATVAPRATKLSRVVYRKLSASVQPRILAGARAKAIKWHLQCD